MTQSMSKQHALMMSSTTGHYSDAGGVDGPGVNGGGDTGGKRGGRETIHSGQFMVSSFETEAKEDDDEKIPIPDDPYEPINKEIETLQNSIISTDVQKYTPKHTNVNNTQLMIETSLSKLFNCMQLTYKQKLTSPKWNHFKGIRLSWKDKIRLNNLIWRCWHSQFMKKKNSMCQFASPIDLDLQIKPEAIVLEGKYWKRDHRVVCAEYRKWRKYYIKNSQEIQNSIDTVREFTRSKENDTDAFLDLIFSSYSNDSRDLAGGSVRADFIQPSLETLQPTIDDIFDTDYLFLKSDYGMQEQLDFFSFSRLPPVPEEGSGDDIYNKPIEYRSIPSIMSSEQLNQTTANITEIANQQSNQVPTIQQTSSSNQQESTMEPVHYQAKMFAHTIKYGQQYNNDFNNEIDMVIDSYPSDDNQDQTMNQAPQSADGAKNFQKGRFSKINYKGFSRREPHNYDKILPTVSQTLIYNQIMAQSQQSQQQQQQQQQQYNNNSTYQDNSAILSALHHNSPIQTTTNNFSLQNIPAQNVLNLSSNQQQQQQQQAANRYLNQAAALQNINILPAQPQSQQTNLMQNVQNLIPMLSINAQHSPPSLQTQNDSQQQESYKAVSSHTINASNEAYKPYHNPHTYKLNSQSVGLGGYTTSLPSRGHMRHKSPPGTVMITDQNSPQSTSQQTKEMYRSHSLPMNAKLQLPPKEEQFVVPNYKIKTAKQTTRSRSNSMVIKHQAILPALQSASSEPMLNTSNSALLQQLLSSSGSTTTSSSNSSNSSTMINKSISSPPLIPSNIFVQTQPQQAQPQQTTSPLSYSNINSPGSSSGNQGPMTGNYSSNQSSPMTTTPVLSPEMLSDSKMSSSSSHFDTNPLSPTKSGNSSNGSGSSRYPRETRRAGHIHAEQKRRYNIKNGFDTLHSLIPQLQQNPNAKLSKAAMLQKGAEYIKQLRNERTQNNEQMETLKRERDNLNNSLNHLHSVLPANGAPISRQRTGRVKEMYTEYIHQRTLQNWKFWIFGLIFEPLLNSFNSTVSVASIDELYRTAKLWVDQNCSLVELRPAVSNKLRYLSTTTDILSDPPSTLHEEVMKAIALRNTQQKQQQPQQPQ